jgi:hypothetical protein
MPERDAEDRYDLGILFVGGIEHQRPGSAVASFSAALYAWLVDWNYKWGQSTWLPDLKDAQLSAGGGEDNEPAHLTLEVPLRLSDRWVHAEWLLAESWWPALFTAPGFLQLTRWIWKVSTCLLVMQFVIPMRRHLRQAIAKKGPRHSRQPISWHSRLPHAWAALCYLGLLAIAGMLSVLSSLLLLALAVAAKLPIPQIDRAVRWTVVKISSTLGDIYVLAHCPVQYAAMRTKVAHDLRSLLRTCKRVAVVAHSQGAAIAHQVLKEYDYDQDSGDLRAFITSGQGISKLHLLQRMDWDPQYARDAWWARTLITFGLACAGLPAFALLMSQWLSAPVFRAVATLPLNIALIAGGLLIVALGVIRATRSLKAVVEQDLQLPPACMRFTWTDYYASADPVSNGSLTEPGSHECTLPDPFNEIHNSGSLLTDHNGYLRNRDQFLPRLLNNLVAAAYGRQEGEKEPPAACRKGESQPFLVCPDDLELVSTRRRRQITYLVIARLITIGFGFALLLNYHLSAVDAQMSSLVRAVPPHAQVTGSPARLMTVLLLTVVTYTAFLIPRRIWERRAVRKFFGTATHFSSPAERPGHEQSAHQEAPAPGPAPVSRTKGTVQHVPGHRAWMPHPRRWNEMVGASTSYETGPQG